MFGLGEAQVWKSTEQTVFGVFYKTAGSSSSLYWIWLDTHSYAFFPFLLPEVSGNKVAISKSMPSLYMPVHTPLILFHSAF